jgi:LacI family transcriptional regulator
MRMQRSGAIGVVTGRITNPFYPELLRCLTRTASERGLTTALWTADAPSADAAAFQAIRGRLVDGLIFTTGVAHDEALAGALAEGTPLVLLSQGVDGLGCDQVTGDNHGGGRLAARYLLGHGRTDVAVISGPPQASTSRDRCEGFIEALARGGIVLPPERLVNCEFDHDSAHAAGMKLLDSPTPPRAVYCGNDLIAFGLLDAARDLGMSVPEDLWVVGYGDVPMAAWSAFDLTTLKLPLADMAKLAVDLLLQRISGERTKFERFMLAADLVVRRSTDFRRLASTA